MIKNYQKTIRKFISLVPLTQPITIAAGFTFFNSPFSAVYANDFQTYFDKGFEKGEKGDYFGSIYDYTSAIELNPNSVDAYYNRGWAKAQINDHSGALLDYQMAVNIDPSYEKALYGLGYSKSQLGNYYGSITDYTRLININPCLLYTSPSPRD